MADKVVFGYLSLLLTALSGGPYLWSVLKHKTKPHIFTHIIWALASGIAAAAQFAGSAGPGAWAATLAGLFSLTTALLALSYGERTITRQDWMSFMLALAIFPLWHYTGDALIAAVMATAIDLLAYYPTFRKSYGKPREEMIFSYVASNAKHLASFLAMAAYTATTLAYPVALFAANTALIVMLVVRRRQVARPRRSFCEGGPE